MFKRMTFPVVLLICACVGGMAPILPLQAASSSAIHLRRATFDPLASTPSIASALPSSASTSLRLVQLTDAPTSTTEATLRAAGLQPLVYIPDNTYLVRVGATPQTALASLRWSGPFYTAYKLPSELDALISATSVATATLRLLTTPDANVAAVTTAIQAAGGTVLGSATRLDGTSLRVQLSLGALAGLLQRDDVLWVEPAFTPRLLNDKGRAIMGIDSTRQQLPWLTGAGQTVAVADTGLDRQNQLSADFAGRVAASITPKQLSSDCQGSDTSDYNGHGTHVSGTILGSGALSPAGSSFAGMAPESQLVVEELSSDGTGLDCLSDNNDTFLSLAYNAGARVQNASWGGPTGGTDSNPTYGAYDDLDQVVDSFLWNHKDHLLVVAAGNEGVDANKNGVIDPDSIDSPATAKNVLSVGASESDRPPTSSKCATSVSSGPNQFCWSAYETSVGNPIASDFVSNNINGMAAFSSRGPADDGRIKPEIVAPGTNIVSARSHTSSASYDFVYDANYAYDSGTSMATPMISGDAALVRQWLAHDRGMATPSAALVKALLLNGTTNITPGQYGTGTQREIPAAWPNNVEGWGRANIANTVQLTSSQVWLQDNAQGLNTGGSAAYPFAVTTQQPLRVTLAWTDYPATPLVNKTLVNDLDLVVQAPDGTQVQGNTTADVTTTCRIAGADRCNNVESVEIATPQIGTYTLRVRGAVVVKGPQPYALVAHIDQPSAVVPQAAPTLQAAVTDSTVALNWTAITGATYYEVQQSTDSSFATVQATLTATDTSTTTVANRGTTFFRVRACNNAGCGAYSNVVQAVVTTDPYKVYLPTIFSP